MTNEEKYYLKYFRSLAKSHQQAFTLLYESRLFTEAVNILSLQYELYLQFDYIESSDGKQELYYSQVLSYKKFKKFKSSWYDMESDYPLEDDDEIEWIDNTYWVIKELLPVINSYTYNIPPPFEDLPEETKDKLTNYFKKFFNNKSQLNIDTVLKYIPKMLKKITNDLLGYIDNIEKIIKKENSE